MSWEYDPDTNSFTQMSDETCELPVNYAHFMTVHKTELTDECIKKIAEVALRELRDSKDVEIHVDLTPREKS